MNTVFRCDDKETLVAYLFDEIDPQVRRDLVAHLRACPSCADEVDALRGVRRDLASWQPPEVELNFAMVQKPATVLRPSRWSAAGAPRWLQAAAAVLLLAGGMALANVQVRYGNDGVTVTTGWLNQQAPPSALAPVSTQKEWEPALVTLASDLRREIETLRASHETTAPRATVASADADLLLRRVQSLVAESERRQQQELALRFARFGRDVQGDLYRMNQGFRQLQGRTGVVEGNQRELVNFVNQVRRVSTQIP
jgi:hypothetical protein